MTSGVRIVVCADGSDQTARAVTLAASCGLPTDGPHELVLGVGPERVELREPDDAPGRGVSVDFTSIALDPHSLSVRQPLARALGRPPGRVVDATAGLGQDAVLAALFGHEVIAIERHPVVAALLADGVNRALANERLGPRLAGRLRVLTGNAAELLPTLDPAPDVVFLDPMFPPKRKKSARAPRAIELVGRLVGSDPDAAALLDVALRTARRRVVAKRPGHAPPIGGTPSGSIEGKLVRYDVYPGTGDAG